MLTTRTVLIVDDEPSLRELLREVFSLERTGRILTASSGNEALKIIRTTKVDAVISDVRMPDGDGIALLDGIREENLDVPVIIMLTGYSKLELEDAYEKGACALLHKPCDLDMITQLTQKALEPPAGRLLFSGGALPAAHHKITAALHTSTAVPPPLAAKLGRGGLFLAMDASFPPIQALVHVALTHKVQDLVPATLYLTGRCRWVRPCAQGPLSAGIGMEFQATDEASLQALSRLWQLHPSRSYIPLG